MQMTSKRIAYLGLLISLAFVFSYLETLIPLYPGIPGAKPGLANLVVITALYTLGAKDALWLSFIRIVLVACTFGNMAGMLYSLAGAGLSYVIMAAAKRTGKLSLPVVSVLGGVFHNVGQLIVAICVLETASLVYYLPALILVGCASGAAIGALGAMVTIRLRKWGGV